MNTSLAVFDGKPGENDQTLALVEALVGSGWPSQQKHVSVGMANLNPPEPQPEPESDHFLPASHQKRRAMYSSRRRKNKRFTAGGNSRYGISNSWTPLRPVQLLPHKSSK